MRPGVKSQRLEFLDTTVKERFEKMRLHYEIVAVLRRDRLRLTSDIGRPQGHVTARRKQACGNTLPLMNELPSTWEDLVFDQTASNRAIRPGEFLTPGDEELLELEKPARLFSKTLRDVDYLPGRVGHALHEMSLCE